MTPILALLAIPQKLPTMQQVREAMHAEVRKLRNYSDAWVMSSAATDSVKLTFERWIDGDRYRCTFKMPDRLDIEQGFDGKRIWFVDHGHKTYFVRASKSLPFASRADLEPLTQKDTFKFNLSGPYDVQMQSNPELKILSVAPDTVGDSKLRKLTAATKLSSGEVKLELWFAPERWRLAKARFIGGPKDEPQEITLEQTRSNDKETFAPGFFSLDEAKLKDYKKDSG